MMKINRFAIYLLFVAAAVFAPCAAYGADAEVTFSITGMDPVNVMRFQDPDKPGLRIGYIQSTEFSHAVRSTSGQAENVDDGILYYTLSFEKLGEQKFRMEISYDFAAPDGRSEGVRNKSLVNIDIIKAITPAEIEEKAQKHAQALADIMFDYFLKYKLSDDVKGSLAVYLKEIITDLLKSMPRDGIMIMRRWDDLAGPKNTPLANPGA